jgi:hypothetical protein
MGLVLFNLLFGLVVMTFVGLFVIRFVVVSSLMSRRA